MKGASMVSEEGGEGAVARLYDRWATTYDEDRNLTRDLDAMATRAVLAEVRCGALLELGCGTGKNTRFYATLAEAVTALDLSEGMLARARERVQDHHVAFQRANLLERWPVADDTQELVAINLVLEHMNGLEWVFGEAARVLRPGGKFWVSEFHPFRQYAGNQAIFRDDGERIRVPAFLHNISDFLDAASQTDFFLDQLREWWDEADTGQPPRLVTFLFAKGDRA